MSLYVDIEKRLGDFHLRVKLEAENETLALLGASGCGKSMTLKCIAGVERPDRGKIIVDGVTFFDSERKIDLLPQKRRTGLLFQDYALFPHMTVLQNIQAGARREKDKARRNEKIKAVMESFDLAELAGHYPHQLSGGQQQRTALARILVSEPAILLLDEPFSALDSHLRFRLEQELRGLLREFGRTAVLVSHDREEVFRLADRLAVMGMGCVEAQGETGEVFKDPQTCTAAMLTGCENISPIKPLGEDRAQALAWNTELHLCHKNAAAVGIRSKDIRMDEGENSFLCRVEEELENSFSYTVLLRPADGGSLLTWETEKEFWITQRKEELRICLPSEKLILLRQ